MISTLPDWSSRMEVIMSGKGSLLEGAAATILAVGLERCSGRPERCISACD